MTFALNCQSPILFIFLLGTIWSQSALDGYAPAGTAHLMSAGIERIEHRASPSGTAYALALGVFAVTAAFAFAFVRFDRKQNTRLWPFVTTGTTRSPPFRA